MRARRSLTLHLGRPCCAGPLCTCRLAAVPEGSIRRALRGGGQRLILRGAPRDATLAPWVEAARRAGFAQIFWAGQAHLFAEEGAPEALREAGVDGLLAPLLSHLPRVYARLAGREGALPRALYGLRAAARAGLVVELELPLLSARLGDPAAALELAKRALPDLRRVRLYAPRGALPRALRPDPLARSGSLLRAALRRAHALGIEAEVDGRSALPLCGLSEPASTGDPLERVRLRLPARRAEGTLYAEGCEACAARSLCPGMSEALLEVEREEPSVARFEELPASLLGGGRSRPRWGSREREASSAIHLMVLRPTVHCNQDCLFCSANESSKNLWSDPKRMLKKIARGAQRGVMRISFSGGEPTLSPHLPRYVAAAARLGIQEIEVVTNGVLLDRPARVRSLAAAGLTHAFVSLHAHDEALSSALTQKRGDHARTLRAIDLLLEAGVKVAVNHVISARSYPYLSAFVELVFARFRGRVPISFAFVSPQYKALERPWLVPRLSEAMPELRRALWRAFKLGQPFVIGSRQGIPPCLLGPFRAWSDVFYVSAESASEDAPQKEQGAACERCRYRAVCRGLWRPYVHRFGSDELRAVEGEPFTQSEIEAIKGHHPRPPWEPVESFSSIPHLLREVEEEERRWVGETEPISSSISPPRSVESLRSRPLRLLLVGAGGRARALLRAEASCPELAFEALASPHAPELGSVLLAGRPAYRSLAEGIEGMRPEGVVIAASTEAHLELALLALAADLPVLLEKPVTATLAEAERLREAEEASGGWVMPAHNLLFAEGLRGYLEALTGAPSSLRWSFAPGSAGAPTGWSERGLYELLVHAFSVLAPGALRAAPREGATDPEVRLLSLRGEGQPEGILLSLGGPAPARVELRFGAPAEELRLEGSGTEGEALYLRRGRSARIEVGGSSRPVPREGSELSLLLRSFAAAARGERGGDAPPSLAEGIWVLYAATAALEAIRAGGAPFSRAQEPLHASTPGLRWRAPDRGPR